MRARKVVAPKTYYVYILAYPDGRVFYVGKGQGNRIDQHEIEAANKAKRTFRNPEKIKIIRQIWAEGRQIHKAIIFETSIEEDAYMYEWALINMTCMAERLTNIRTNGMRWSPQHKTKPKPELPQKQPKPLQKMLLTKSGVKVEPTMTRSKHVEHPNLIRTKLVKGIPVSEDEEYLLACEAANYLNISRFVFVHTIQPNLFGYQHGGLKRIHYRRSDLEVYREKLNVGR